MLVGVTSSGRVPQVPDALRRTVRVLTSPTVETLLTDFALGACDVVGLTPPLGKAVSPDDFAVVCRTRPASSVWMSCPSGATWTPVAFKQCGGSLHPGRGAVRLESPVATIRRVWLEGWATDCVASSKPGSWPVMPQRPPQPYTDRTARWLPRLPDRFTCTAHGGGIAC